MPAIKTLLVFPPFANHTHPYLSVPALTAFLAAAGKDVRSWDLNLDFYEVLYSRKIAEVCHKQYIERFDELRSQDTLNSDEGQEFRQGARRLAQIDGLFGKIEEIRDRARSHVNGPVINQGREMPYTWWVLLEEYLQAAYFSYPESTVGYGKEGSPLYRHKSYHLGNSHQLVQAADDANSIVDLVYDHMDLSLLDDLRPDVIGLSLPFEHNVIPALKFARRARKVLPDVHLVFGGGFPSCHWRDMSTAAHLFDIFDSVVVDDGEAPLLSLIDALETGAGLDDVPNLIHRDASGTVIHNSIRPADRIDDRPAPTFANYDLDRYFTSTKDHSCQLHLPLILAHGCYWRKCTFCDINLQYVGDYQNQSVDRIMEKIRQMVDETGIRYFHFVDEAAPPALLRMLSERLIAEGPDIHWHTNIRFEKSYDPHLASLMAKAGCWAIEGGVEVAVDRVLKLIDKGTTREQVTGAARCLRDAGIEVRGYFMVGFPTETRDEAFQAIDYVQGHFREKMLTGGKYHHFHITRGAPAFHNPSALGITKMTPDPELDLWDTISDFETVSGMTTQEAGQLAPIFNKMVQNFTMGRDLDHPVERLVEVYGDPNIGLSYMTAAEKIELVDSTEFTDHGLTLIARIGGLVSLNLSGCVNLTDQGFAALSGLRRLRELNLTLNHQLTDDVFNHLRSMVSIRSLVLSWCRQISRKGLAQLPRLPQLENLYLSGLDSLDDDALTLLCRMQTLRILDLSECRHISDKATEILGTNKGLRMVNLKGCPNITPSGLNELRAALPRCQILSA